MTLTPSEGLGVSYWGLDQSETCTSSEGSTNERAVLAPHKWARLLQQHWKPCCERTENPVAMDTLEYCTVTRKNSFQNYSSEEIPIELTTESKIYKE